MEHVRNPRRNPGPERSRTSERPFASDPEPQTGVGAAREIAVLVAEYGLPHAFALDYWVVERLGVRAEQWAHHCNESVADVERRVRFARQKIESVHSRR